MRNKNTTLKLGIILTAVTGLLIAVTGAIAITAVNRSMRQQALEEAEEKYRMLLDRNLATHYYFSHVVKPRLFEWTEPIRPDDYFDPTWMSSTYAVREIDRYFHTLNPQDYRYKECAVNARSPMNEADEYERAFLQKLNSDPGLETRRAIRNLDDGPYFTVLRKGEVLEESCLRCHGNPVDAPGGLLDVYGGERSFHRKTGDAVSAISIAIPLSEAYAGADRNSFHLSILLAVLLIALFILQSWIYWRFLFRPLAGIRQRTIDITTNGGQLGEQIQSVWRRTQ